MSYFLCLRVGLRREVFILTAAYLYLRQYLAEPTGIITALILGGLFACIRVYPRFWNMWIQSTYPDRLLAVEFVNGTIVTFVIVAGLQLLAL